MKNERELIPFEPAALLGEKLLVLAPHPDDEVIGCGGLIALHRQQNREVLTVVVTDGSAAATGTEAGYATRREAESNAGLELLRANPAVFLRFPDRRLSAHRGALEAALAEIIDRERPDVIAVPSPIEIHPDHVTLAEALVAVHQSRPKQAGMHAMQRIAFYEVSQPIRPNTLVDITKVSALKFDAIGKHASQLAIRGYRDFASGLNRYRSMTLSDCEYAEGYFVVSQHELLTTPLSLLRRRVAGLEGAGQSDAVDATDVTVIVRTRNRPSLLTEAIASIRSSSEKTRIIVVDDGSTPPVALEDPSISLLRFEGVGRSRAMNAGVDAAATQWIAFLDDDDLFYPEHLPLLLEAAASNRAGGYYTDAVSTSWSPAGGRTGTPLRTYADDFDRTLLLFDNYIPLNSLMIRRKDFQRSGGFSPEFDLFEDWDFLLRLTRDVRLERVPKITCEVRHFRDSGSAVLDATGKTAAFHAAKARVWSRHPEALDPTSIAAYVERVKERTSRLHSETVELRGLNAHHQLDIRRLERERRFFESELLRVTAELSSIASRFHQEQAVSAALRTEIDAFRNQAIALAESSARSAQLAAGEKAGLEHSIRQKDESIDILYGEIARLNGILQTIYGSRTWKLHQLAERMKRKGA